MTEKGKVNRGRFTMRNWFTKEAGTSTVAAFILLLPVLIISFGLGFEALRFVYIKDKMQDVLDGAAQTAVAQTISQTDESGRAYIALDTTDGSYSTGGPDYTYGTTEGKAKNFYLMNTERLRENKIFCTGREDNGDCQARPASQEFYVIENGEPVLNTELGSSFLYATQLCTNFGESSQYGVEYKVAEEVPTAFLYIVGIPSFDLELESKAYVRGRNC